MNYYGSYSNHPVPQCAKTLPLCPRRGTEAPQVGPQCSLGWACSPDLCSWLWGCTGRFRGEDFLSSASAALTFTFNPRVHRLH